MRIKHIKTGVQRDVTDAGWEAMFRAKISKNYVIIEPPIPAEIKNVRRAKSEKKAESDNNELTNIDDRLLGKDAGEIE